MNGLPRNNDPNLLVGYHTSDDAGIYKLTEDIAVVTTADALCDEVFDALGTDEDDAALLVLRLTDVTADLILR